MSKLFPIATALFLSASAALFAQSIAWREDLEAALNEARKSDKVVMIDVFTDWCGWCDKLDQEVYTDPGVIALSGNFVNLKINPEKEARAAEFLKQFKVNGYPTILFIEPDGALVNRIGGYLEAGPFADRMKTTGDYRVKIKSYRAEFAAGDYGNSFGLISMLAELGRGAEAAPVFDKVAAGAVFSPSQREVCALAIAKGLLDDEDFARALDYATIAEGSDSGSENVYVARYYRSVATFYTSGKAAAVKYLETCLIAGKTPEIWKKRYVDLKDRINKAK
jgi:thioredoxin-related protein